MSVVNVRSHAPFLLLLLLRRHSHLHWAPPLLSLSHTLNLTHTLMYIPTCDAVARIYWRNPAASRWQFWALSLFSPSLSLSIPTPFFGIRPRLIELGLKCKMSSAYRPARTYPRTMRAGCLSATPRVAGGQGFCSIRPRFPALSALAISDLKPSSSSTGFTTPAAPFGRLGKCIDYWNSRWNLLTEALDDLFNYREN